MRRPAKVARHPTNRRTNECGGGVLVAGWVTLGRLGFTWIGSDFSAGISERETDRPAGVLKHGETVGSGGGYCLSRAERETRNETNR